MTAKDLGPSEDANLDRLSRLVDHRIEELDVEYKSWLDLSDAENRSKIAKHLCALANFGGGWIVFGIDDDGSHSEPHPADLGAFSQDTINGIVSRYLHPAFHCSVRFVRSPTSQKEYPVVVVPSHGGLPICAKSDGPQVGKHRIGVIKGVHYIRTQGPKSVPIDSPELWRELLHRCVLTQRGELLSSIGRLFDRPAIIENSPFLNDFVDQAIANWSVLKTPGWPTDPSKNFGAVSFQFLADDGPIEPISLKGLLTGVSDASSQADKEREFTSPPFDMTYSGMVKPFVFLHQEIEGYECHAITENGTYVFSPFLARVLTTGVGVEIRTYHEDSDWITQVVQGRSSRKWIPGAHLSPKFQASRIHAFVIFVRNLSRLFPSATKCLFLVDFDGLEGRSLAETRLYFSRSDQISSTSRRRSRLEVNLEKLAGDGASEIAASLLNPTLRLFGGAELTAEFIRQHKLE